MLTLGWQLGGDSAIWRGAGTPWAVRQVTPQIPHQQEKQEPTNDEPSDVPSSQLVVTVQVIAEVLVKEITDGKSK